MPASEQKSRPRPTSLQGRDVAKRHTVARVLLKAGLLPGRGRSLRPWHRRQSTMPWASTLPRRALGRGARHGGRGLRCGAGKPRPPVREDMRGVIPLQSPTVVDQQHLRQHQGHEGVPLVAAAAVDHEPVGPHQHPAMVAADDSRASTRELRRRVQHRVAAEEGLGLRVPRVPALQALELLLTALRAVCLQAGMHEDEAAEKGMLLDVHPGALLQEVEVLLRHRLQQAVTISLLHAVGREGGGGAIAPLVAGAGPAEALEVHVVRDVVVLLTRAPPALPLVVADCSIFAVPRLAECEVLVRLRPGQETQEAQEAEFVVSEQADSACAMLQTLTLQGRQKG
mmetsp:Transcript_53278/g.155201  ORF Transcript_53278/g.155201 Transcript_53278/m.155201 type:complete len:340 (-) Transcript_53278:417-1436(-)